MSKIKDVQHPIFVDEPLQGNCPTETSQKSLEEMQEEELSILSEQIHRLCSFIIEDYRYTEVHGLRTEDSNYGKSYELKEEGNE